MSAVQMPEEFTIWVCYATLALTALALMLTSLYIHNQGCQIGHFMANSWPI